MKLTSVFNKRNRVLLRELVITDFKLRYQGSVLGYAWSLLKPLFLFAIMYVVFGMLIKLGSIEHFAVYLLLGIVLWNFFAEVVTQGMGSIVGRGDLIRKINFPKYIVVVATSISAFINLLINLVVVAVLMVVNGVEFSAHSALIVVFILEIFTFALGLAFFLSALNVRYRDIGHIWEILLQAVFYATPIIYPLSIVVDKSIDAAQLMLMNPIAQAIQDARYVSVTNDTATFLSLYANTWLYAIPISLSILTLIIGVKFFNGRARKFAEEM